MTEQEILDKLDNSSIEYYGSFVELGHPYSFLLDTRLNVFRGDNDRWAIAVEKLGYNPRAGCILLEIHYYGNCLINLGNYNKQLLNEYSVLPIDMDNFEETTDGEALKPDAKFWLVRGHQVPLTHTKQAYADAGIELQEYEPDTIGVEEAARLVLLTNRDLFRATDNELYKCIPADLKKILVLDEWFHKDFFLNPTSAMLDEHLRQTYEFNKNLTGLGGVAFESFAQARRMYEIQADTWNKEEWETNRPGSYETWQLIAKVIVTNDPTHYKPTLQPNTHWIHWPDSGSL
ncbi:hypothetical protein QNI19_36935 [Cytophagaceae bacterium DM2B3-1]|uniref:Uncharacterized protein n=1 Tax=Xanthocytophaga flava TaxID=3048013 RepID=A0ABT7D1B2_9BACT|nr:hypothetical protein [Xanthocytophaga flavus]MDJ1498579.1 hypothetical protein [Xanthocytophaga flavus]